MTGGGASTFATELLTAEARQRLAAAVTTAAHRQARTAEPNTWIKLGIVIVVVVTLSVVGTLAWYPSFDTSTLPEWFKLIQAISFVPMIGSVIAAGWLFGQSFMLWRQPTRRITALVTGCERSPDGQALELLDADGKASRHRCRGSAGSMVKVGTINRGEVGVALCKGDTVLEWVPIPV